MSGRGRPGKREQILNAARQQFLEHGFDGASVDAIVVAAGVSKPTIYAHFPTKEALLAAVVQAEVDAHPLPFDFQPTNDVRADLERLAGLLLMAATDPVALSWDRMLAGYVRHHPEVGQRFYDAGPTRILHFLAELFRSFDAAGRLSIPDPAMAADFFFGLTVGVPLLRAQVTGQVTTPDEQATRARNVADTFLRAFAAGDTRRRTKPR